MLLQWNKMYMNLDIDEPVVVMDIDVLLTNNYKDLFEYPIKKATSLFLYLVGGVIQKIKDIR